MVLVLDTAESEIWECTSCDGDGIPRARSGMSGFCRHCGGKGRIVILKPQGSFIRAAERGVELGRVFRVAQL